MLNDWMYWLSLRTWDEWLLLLIGLVLLDGPRYCLCTTVSCLYDWVKDSAHGLFSRRPEADFTHCPTVCMAIVGLNEGATLGATLESVLGSYPRLEIVVVDDGSDDEMSEVGRAYASRHQEVTVFTRPWRGGKSSALNIAASNTQAEIVICVDADSHLGENALWEIVQPFRDENVGSVSATVCARNAFHNLVTWMQGFEYLQSIFVGRRVSARLNTLPIASGAFAAFRRELIDRVGGWDVGPGEDLDLTLRIRRMGYRVEFAQYAFCHTEVPTTWKALFKQRRRWDGDGPVRHLCRKHNDLANPLYANFRVSNLFTFLDGVIFNLFCGYGLLIWVTFAICYRELRPEPFTFLTMYIAAALAELLPLGALLYYSRTRLRDATLALAIPLMPIYRLALLLMRIFANTAEILIRKSFSEPHVPPHVREATWRW